MYLTKGFEANSLEALITDTASYYAFAGKFKNEEYVAYSVNYSEYYLSKSALKDFNEKVRDKIEELEEIAYINRSDSQKYNDYCSDCADNNWKERS